MAISAFTPTGYAQLAVGAVSGNVLIPTAGSPTAIVVTNIGPEPAVVLLGNSNAVAASISTGMAVLPNHSVALTIGANTYLAAISIGAKSILNLAVGS